MCIRDRYTYDQTDFAHMLEWPSRAHLFGTDKMGRDIFVRTMYGALISLTIGFAAAAINMVIGVFYGGIAGYIGGRTDMIMMRLVDILSGCLLYTSRNQLPRTVNRPADGDHAGPEGGRLRQGRSLQYREVLREDRKHHSRAEQIIEGR